MRLPKNYKLKKDYLTYRKKFQRFKKTRGYVLQGERMLSPKQYQRAVESFRHEGYNPKPSDIAKSQVGVATKKSWEAYNKWYDRYQKIIEKHGDSMKQKRLTRAEYDLKFSQYKELLEDGERPTLAKIIAQDQAYMRTWRQARALKNAIMVAAVAEVDEVGMDDQQASDFLSSILDEMPSTIDIMMGKEEEYLESNDLLWDAIRSFREQKISENPNYDRKLLAKEVAENFFYMKPAVEV